MNLTNKFRSLAVILLSCFIAFLAVEYLYRLIKSVNTSDSYSMRSMLFESGNNFLNYDGYIKYFPNISIQSMTVYSKREPKNIEDLVIEYNYIISTNNEGLVMQNDIYYNDRVLFVIGDSFTEGQGASPWFYIFEDNYDKTLRKPVNLGILGTGPMQWLNLAKSVVQQKNLKVDGIVINIIPADMTRKVWNLNEAELECLHNTNCNYNYGFQGFQFSDKNNYENIKKTVLNNINRIKDIKTIPQEFSYVQLIKDYARNSAVIYDLYTMFFLDHNQIFKQNEDALISLKDLTNEKFFVNVLTEKELDSSNYNNYPNANRLINFLMHNDIDFAWCNIPKNGFHKIDGHPNYKGYEIVRECTENAVKSIHM